MSASFTHLHNHSHFSFLDGAAQLDELVAEAKRLEMPAIAVTDHGNMFGSYEFFQAAKIAGIKPILGIEAYAAPQSRHHKKPVYWGESDQRSDDVSGNGAYTHVTLLAETPQGLRNLFKLSSLASIEGGYYKPRADRELLAEYSTGVIATTGCPGGEVQTRLRLGQEREALQAAADFRDIFGEENYFLELMDHGLDIERKTREGLLEIGRKLSLSPVATNDCHYVTRDQAKAHDALLCVQVGKTLDDPKRFKFDGDGYYLKSAAEMRTLFDAEACDTTLAIAERIQPYDEVFAQVDRMPRFDVPEGETQSSWLAKRTWAGLARRFPDGVTEEYRARAAHELNVIDGKGYPAYFLVVEDITDYARSRNIRVGPGRGSGPGCLVAYALGITEVDPIVHQLIFERFLNPQRPSMPDIDLDIDERYRGEMIRYLTERWGDDRVCQIVTFNKIKAKAALKDSARVLGLPYLLGDQLSKAFPLPISGKDASLAAITDTDHPRHHEATAVREIIESDPDAKQVLETAQGLEGLIRQPGVHASGVVVSGQPLLDVLPIWRRDDGAIVSGWDFVTCEDVGLLKVDFLGLRNLTILSDAVESIRLTEPDFELDATKLEDPQTYELLARGDTLGVFQLDGAQMRELLRAMAPTGFADIAAVLALYRPGPMGVGAHMAYADRKNGREPVEPIHPEFEESLAEILDPTFGLIVFQEQVISIAQKLAGYSLGAADLLRRAMGKKKKDVLDREFETFSGGMRANGYSEDAISTLWHTLLPFAMYAFNRSHSVSYGILSFWTAYLKTYYPTEFMAALLSSVDDDKDKMAIYLAECRHRGIAVLPPDVNTSTERFTPVKGSIRFGLGAVRNIGEGPVSAIVATRNAHGRFESFTDFLAKVPASVCNKRVIASLIKAGAFDSLGHHRQALFELHSSAVDYALENKRQDAIGQVDLFGDLTVEPPPEGPEWPRDVLLAHEREMLGLYVSDHPLRGVDLRKHASRDIATILAAEPAQDAPVTIAGLITAVNRKTTKKDGKRWAAVSIEDLDATMEVLVFPREYEELSGLLAVDAVVAVKGRINRRDDTVSVVTTDMFPLDAVPAVAPVTLTIPAISVTRDLMDRLKVVCVEHKGTAELRIELTGHVTTVLVAEGYPIDPCPSSRRKLK